MINEIKSPDNIDGNNAHSDTLFLAGGISNCPDWQGRLVNFLTYNFTTKFTTKRPLYLVNPRRKEGILSDNEIAKEQIEWEYRHLKRCNHHLFWFPKETVCPITLFELGKYAQIYTDLDSSNLIVGTHSDYSRKFDVKTQLNLMFPEMEISNTFIDLLSRVVNKFQLEFKENL